MCCSLSRIDQQVNIKTDVLNPFNVNHKDTRVAYLGPFQTSMIKPFLRKQLTAFTR